MTEKLLLGTSLKLLRSQVVLYIYIPVYILLTFTTYRKPVIISHDSSDLQVHDSSDCLTSRENFFLLMETSMSFYTVSFFLRSSTIVFDIYTCCRALRTVATFTCFKTRVFHDRNCHNRPSDLRDERSNKMRRRRDKTKG